MRNLTLRTVACAALLPLVLAACTKAPNDGTSTALETDRPLPDDQITVHMLTAPELPAALDGAVVTKTELRQPQLFERYEVQLVDVPAATSVTLSEMLPAGALIRVPAGATLEVGAAVDVAPLAGDEVTAIEASCAAPCVVTGPALVASDGWLTNWGVQPGWLILVPAPSAS